MRGKFISNDYPRTTDYGLRGTGENILFTNELPSASKRLFVGDQTYTTRGITVNERRFVTTTVDVPSNQSTERGFILDDLMWTGFVQQSGQFHPQYGTAKLTGEAKGTLKVSQYSFPSSGVYASVIMDPAPYNNGLVFLWGGYASGGVYLSTYSGRNGGDLTSEIVEGAQPEWNSVNESGTVIYGYESMSNLVYRGPIRWDDGDRGQMYSAYGRYDGHLCIFTWVIPSGYPWRHTFDPFCFTQTIRVIDAGTVSECKTAFVGNNEAYLGTTIRLMETAWGDWGGISGWGNIYDHTYPGPAGYVDHYKNASAVNAIDMSAFWLARIPSSAQSRAMGAFEGCSVDMVEHGGGAVAMLSTNYLAADRVGNTPVNYANGRLASLVWLNNGSYSELDLLELHTTGVWTQSNYNPYYSFGFASATREVGFAVIQDRITKSVRFYKLTFSFDEFDVITGASIESQTDTVVNPYLAQNLTYSDTRVRFQALAYKSGENEAYRLVILLNAYEGKLLVREWDQGWGDVQFHDLPTSSYTGLGSLTHRDWREHYLWADKHPTLIV